MRLRRDPERLRSPAPWRGPLLLLVAACAAAAVSFTGDGDSGELCRTARALIAAPAPHLDRERGIAILAGLGPAAAAEALELAASPDPMERLAGVRVLASAGLGPESFHPFLGDPCHAARVAALEGLRNAAGLNIERLRGDSKLPPAFDVRDVAPLLNDPFWPVRRAAAVALAMARTTAAAECALRALADPEPAVRQAVLHCLVELPPDLPAGVLRQAAAGLGPAELILFLQRALPLAGPANASCFAELAAAHGGSTAGVLALACAVAGGSAAARQHLVEHELGALLDVSAGGAGDAARAADTLLGWAGREHPDRLVASLTSALAARRLEPGFLASVAWAALRQDAVPVLEDWAREHGTDDEVVLFCLNGLTTAASPAAGQALARLLPCMEDRLRAAALEKGARLLELVPQPDLAAALEEVALHEDGKPALIAFSGICRAGSTTPAAMGALLERFSSEPVAATRSGFARSLAAAGRGELRGPVVKALLSEVRRAGPAAVEAASSLARVAEPEDLARFSGALQTLYEQLSAAGDREVVLLALVQLGEPGADEFVAARTQALWDETDASWISRVAGHLRNQPGPATAALLRAMAGDEKKDLSAAAVRSLLARNDPAALRFLAETFPQLSSRARASFIEVMDLEALGPEAVAFVTKVLESDRHSAVMAAAIEALPAQAARGIAATLLGIARPPWKAGGEAAEAAIRALGRSGDDAALAGLRGDIERLLATARTAGPAFFAIESTDVSYLLAVTRALAENQDPQALPLIAGFLYQAARARWPLDVREEWYAAAGGPRPGPQHTWLRRLLEDLLQYPDEAAEAAVLFEVDGLEACGDLFLMGDASFGVVFRELAARRRCPRVAARMADLVFRCRPDLSPAEFRVSLLLAEQSAGAGRYADAARHTLRAYFIAEYNSPARAVLRDELAERDPFTGYEPEAALAAEAYALLADDAAAHGRGDEALRLAGRARQRCPFLTLPAGAAPHRLGPGDEGGE